MTRLLGIILGLTAILIAVLFGAASVALFAEDKGSAFLTAGVAVFFGLLGRRWISRQKSDSWRSGPATQKQKTFADDLGIKYPKNISKGDLSDLIDEAL